MITKPVIPWFSSEADSQPASRKIPQLIWIPKPH
jgi:hypothetical protein